MKKLILVNLIVILYFGVSISQVDAQVKVLDVNNYEVGANATIVPNEITMQKVDKVGDTKYAWKGNHQSTVEWADKVYIVKVAKTDGKLSYCLACYKNNIMDHMEGCISEKEYNQIK